MDLILSQVRLLALKGHSGCLDTQQNRKWMHKLLGGPLKAALVSWALCLQRTEYNRLKDAKGKPPGLIGWWPSRSVTFLENHDTVRASAPVFSLPGLTTTRGTQPLFEECCHCLAIKPPCSIRSMQIRALMSVLIEQHVMERKVGLVSQIHMSKRHLSTAIPVAAGPLNLLESLVMHTEEAL